MPRFSASRTPLSRRTRRAALLLAALLPALATGCDAIYEDTKGWASRLEASILESAEEDPGEAAAPAPATIAAKPQEMAPPPAVPVTPVTTTVLAAPETAKATAKAASAAPSGAMADASAALLAVPAEAPAPSKPPAPAAEPAAKMAALPPLPKPKPAPAAVAAAPGAAKAADDPVVAVVLHLSSLRSEEAAKRQWSDLQHSFPEPLGRLQAEFSRTDLGDKGTFYRVLAGPLSSRDKASEVCAAVKAKDAKQYCRVLPQQPKG